MGIGSGAALAAALRQPWIAAAFLVGVVAVLLLVAGVRVQRELDEARNRRKLREGLAARLKECEDMRNDVYAGNSVSNHRFQTWNKDTEDWLEANLDHSYVVLFHSVVGIQYVPSKMPVPAISPKAMNVVTHLERRMVRLDQFLQEIKK